MSSARKRAAIQKANNEADDLRQRLMLAAHNINVMQHMAEEIARRSDALHASAVAYIEQADAVGSAGWLPYDKFRAAVLGYN